METFLPEILRLKGEYPASAGPVGRAEDLFRRSIDIARHQQAKMWELRTSTSLARLLQAHGDRNAARDLLAPIYNWFTEGFDTADLKEAKTLLGELSR